MTKLDADHLSNLLRVNDTSFSALLDDWNSLLLKRLGFLIVKNESVIVDLTLNITGNESKKFNQLLSY